MELHRLDGIEASGLDNIDIQDINYEEIEERFSASQVEALEALGYVHGPDIVYEIQDEEGNVVMYADAEENLYVMDGLGELGFLKKIGRGLKNAGRFVRRKVVKPVARGVRKAAKFTGKKVLKPALKTFNRFVNPATILLRNGFLLAMKVNLMKVAERLRFGYLSDAEARKRGVSMSGFAKLKQAVQKAEKIYDLAGGKKSNLKRAILTGKGNNDKAVPLSGFALGNPSDIDPTDEFTDPFEQFIVEADPELVEAFINDEVEVEGLGEPASGAAIAAASGAVATVSALLNKISGVFDRAKNVKAQAQNLVSLPGSNTQAQPQITSPKTPSAQKALDPIFPKPIRSIPNALQRFTPKSTEIPANTPNRLPQSASQKINSAIPMQADPDISNENTSAKVNQPPSDDQQSWFQKNQTPLLITSGVILAGVGIWYAVKKSSAKTKKSSVEGVPTKKERSRDELGRFTSAKGKKKKHKRSVQKFTPTALL